MEILILTLTLILGLMLLNTSSPVTGILSVIGIFVMTAGLIAITSQIYALSLFFIIIYVGAIAILFLFVIFLLNLKKVEEKIDYRNCAAMGAAMTLFPLVLIKSQGSIGIDQHSNPIELTAMKSQISNWTVMYSTPAFWLIGIVLLVAMIAVILLAHRIRT